MKLKMLFAAVISSVMLLGIVTPTVSQAKATMETVLDRNSIKLDVEEIEGLWYTWSFDNVLYSQFTSTGIYGFEYTRHTASGEYIHGSSLIYNADVLPSDWVEIRILSRDDRMHGAVLAVNHADGTATLYDPYQSGF